MLYTTKVKNGDHYEPWRVFQCDKCGCKLQENYPRYCEQKGIDYCYDCSFKMGLIDCKRWMNAGTGFTYGMFKAAIDPETGNIELALMRSKFSWELTNKDYRQTAEYQKWRESVFKRDQYTCQYCKQVGGVLNAHHIKLFSKHKKLRFNIDNGITLCLACHRKIHNKKKEAAV